MSPVTAHTHKRLNICYLSYASTLDFVIKTHSFRDKMLQIFRIRTHVSSLNENYFYWDLSLNEGFFIYLQKMML